MSMFQNNNNQVMLGGKTKAQLPELQKLGLAGMEGGLANFFEKAGKNP